MGRLKGYADRGAHKAVVRDIGLMVLAHRPTEWPVSNVPVH